MATHQLYDGGAANSNLSRTQYPSPVFSATDATIKKIDIAQHYGSPWAVMRKVLDFKNDYALRKYFTDNAVAASDVLNLLILPAKTLFLGAFVEVENPADNGTAITASFATAGGILLGDTSSAAVAIDLTTAAARFSAPNAPWIAANGAMSLATAQALVTPDIIQMTLASLAQANLGGFGNLRLNVAALIVQANENPATNF